MNIPPIFLRLSPVKSFSQTLRSKFSKTPKPPTKQTAPIHMKTPIRSIFRFPLSAFRFFSALILLSAPAAFAVDAAWTGTTNSTWSTTTNWSASPVPGVGNTATFNSAGNGNTAITVGTISLTNITFDTASAAAYTIGSGVDTITLATGTTTAVTMNSTVAQNETINANLILGTAIASTTTFTNNSTTNLLTLGGNITGGTGGVGVAKTIIVTGAGNTSISGSISNGGGTSVAVQNSGVGTLTLSGNNSYSGATSASVGTLVLSGTNSSAGTTTTSTGATLQLANTTANNGGLASGTLTIGNGTTLTVASAGPLTISNSVNGTQNYTISGSQSLTINGTFQKIGNGGTLTNNITGGNLTLNGPVYLSDSAAGRTLNLGGNGSIIVNGNIANFNGVSTGPANINTGTTGTTLTINGNNNTYNGTTLIGGGAVILNGTISASFISLNSLNSTFTESTSGVLSGSSSLSVSTGTIATVAGNNTYAGGTTITSGSGTLNINSATALGTGNFTINGGKIDNTSAAAITLTNNNVQAWNGNFAFTGTKDLNLGTGAVTMNASRQVTVNGGNLTVGGSISGSTFGLTKAGVGTLVLSGANTYNGTTTLTTGTLQLGNGGATGSLSTGSVISIASGTSLTINRSNAVVQGTDFSTAGITGAGNFIQAGAGTTTLNAANSYSGNTTVSAGTLQFAKTQALYNGANASWTAAKIVVASGGTLAFNVGGAGEFSTGNVTTLLTNLAASSSSTNGMALGSILGFDTTNASGGNFSIGDVIANTTGATGGARGLTKLGTNTLILTNANTYTGATTISAGTLQIGSGSTTGNLSASSAITNNGSLTFNRSNAVVQGTDFSSAGIIGTGSLTQAGSGNLTLNVTNSYSGATTVSSGTLILSATLSNSAVTVSGGTLQGTGTATQGITMTSGTLAPGNSPGLLTAGSLTLSGGTTAFEINGTARGSTFDAIDITSGGAIQFGGAFTIAFGSLLSDGATLDLFNFTTSSSGDFSSLISTGSYAGTWTRTGEVFSFTSGGGQTLSFSEITGDLSVVPEPATWALLAFSLTTVMVLRRRRRE